MGAPAIAFPNEAFDDKYEQMIEYLSSEGGYWLNNDNWELEAVPFREAGIGDDSYGTGVIADFSEYDKRLKVEMKFFLLCSMKEKMLSVSNIYEHYKKIIPDIGRNLKGKSLNKLEPGDSMPVDPAYGKERRRLYSLLVRNAAAFIIEHYDERSEFEKDVWHAVLVPGARLSAAALRQKPSMSFVKIPEHYRETVKRFMERLVIKRSWSYCTEMLVYIRYFFRSFYEHGYGDGFLEKVSRRDMEHYLVRVADDYAGKNATFRSKAVSFIRQFIDYLQLAEYSQAPEKDVNRLIFEDDIPRRERTEDTMSKVKYIPEPVREQLDAGAQELEPKEMRPVYILLRESGWRGTDILNLRYDSCLDHRWNEREQIYIPYLCGEITKTGIPMLKIPIRQEVAGIVKELAEEAVKKSTDDNNPEHYLFNTYEGKNKGLPYSKPAFTSSVQKLINRKGILDGNGDLYHFKAHSLRHTRALEYTEQGMPIGIIQQVLGHCSLQMTLHYSKVTENMLYEKWKETEKLSLLHLDSRPPEKNGVKEEGLHYEFVRKNLDAVKVPFGVCFKPSKLPCRQQMNHCIECANFCTCNDNIPEYEAEIERLGMLLTLSHKLGRDEWEEKNQKYLDTLEKMLERIRTEGLIHKNGKLREDCDGQ